MKRLYNRRKKKKTLPQRAQRTPRAIRGFHRTAESSRKRVKEFKRKGAKARRRKGTRSTTKHQPRFTIPFMKHKECIL